MRPTRLYINIDHVATVREARKTDEPDPVAAALLCQEAGADGITAHLREDRRHIQDHDVERLNAASKVFNLELATSADVVDLACRLRPYQATLVPERREEVTTEGGLDVVGQLPHLSQICRTLAADGIRVSLFIDPDTRQIDASRVAGAAVVELHTGAYAEATGERRALELARIADAARIGASLGLTVHAGHGLHYHNVQPVAAIDEIVELNIGHAIVARAIVTGIAAAVSEMKALMLDARRSRQGSRGGGR